MTANMAYGEVTLGGIYEEPDKMVPSVGKQLSKQPVAAAGGYTVDQPSESDYDTVGENVKSTEQQQPSESKDTSSVS